MGSNCIFVPLIRNWRTIFLLAVVTACHGVWCLEQPGSSVMEFYPTWLHFMNAMYEFYGEFAATYLNFKFKVWNLIRPVFFASITLSGII